MYCIIIHHVSSPHHHHHITTHHPSIWISRVQYSDRNRIRSTRTAERRDEESSRPEPLACCLQACKRFVKFRHSATLADVRQTQNTGRRAIGLYLVIDDNGPSTTAPFPMFSFLRAARGGISGVTAPALLLSSGLLAGAYAAAGTDTPPSDTGTSNDAPTPTSRADAPLINDAPAAALQAAIYLDVASVATLKADFPSLFANRGYDRVVILESPTQAEYGRIDKSIGKEVSVEVLAHINDDADQFLYCRVLPAKDGTAIKAVPTAPRVVLSNTGADGTGVLVDRLRARGVLGKDAGRALPETWSGILPMWRGQGGRLHGLTPATVTSVRRPPLTGTLCTNRRWDPSTQACGAAPECGFCKFMKGGPCKDTFVLWEACIDRVHEEDSGDVVESCTKETLELKKCIDEHPEYYGVLAGNDDEEEGEGAQQEA